MAAYNKFTGTTSGVDMIVKAANLATDAFKIYLTNAVSATDVTYNTGTTLEITAGNGYTAGGNSCSTTSATTTGGVFKLILASPATWTATGAVGPFRYAVLYDSTQGTNNLIGYWDYGSSITMASGDTFSVTLDGTNGVFTVT